MKTVKVYQYEEFGTGTKCTDLVVDDRIYPFLTEVIEAAAEIKDFSLYDYYPLKNNLPDHAVLVHEYQVEG